jgi:hypothetical protein
VDSVDGDAMVEAGFNGGCYYDAKLNPGSIMPLQLESMLEAALIGRGALRLWVELRFANLARRRLPLVLRLISTCKLELWVRNL